jgi:hypothetical protein
MIEWTPVDGESLGSAEPWEDDPRFIHFDGLLLGGWSDKPFQPDEISEVPAV